MHRESLLQGASTKNNDFQNATQSLDTFLDNLPNNKVRPSDNLFEVQTKQASQEVSGLNLYTCTTIAATILYLPKLQLMNS